MNNRVSIVACLLLLPLSSFAQEPEIDEFAGKVNRMLSSMQLILDESQNADSVLEIVGEQKSKLTELRAEYKMVIQAIQRLDDVEQDVDAATAALLNKMDGFEKTLHTDILLPHQSDALNSLVFAKFVKENGGNVLRAIAKHYPKDFQLDDQQKEKMIEIDERVKKQVSAAKERLKVELEKIANGARRDAENLLTPKQVDVLKKFGVSK